MPNDIKPFNITPHAWKRWERRFPGLDFVEAFERSTLKFTRGGDYHLYDIETSAEFVCRRSEKGAWYVITVMLLVSRAHKFRHRRQRRYN